MEELPVLFLQYENDPRMGVQKEIERARRRKMDYDKELARTEALQEYEREYSAYAHICGIDEVGRGPLAGPVVAGAVISFLGWYEPFQEFAGAGAGVPLLGFGNVLMKGVKEAVDEQGFLGLFAGGFKAGAVGTAAALIFGYLASLVFRSKMKK